VVSVRHGVSGLEKGEGQIIREGTVVIDKQEIHRQEIEYKVQAQGDEQV
jgi:hypothetical protein